MRQLKIYIDDYSGRKAQAFVVNVFKPVNSCHLIIEVYTPNNEYIGCDIKILGDKSNEISTFNLVGGIITAVKDSPYKIISDILNVDYFIMDNTVNPVEGEIIKGNITLYNCK